MVGVAVKVGVMVMAEEISFSELYVTKALGRQAQQPTRRYHFSITINYVASGLLLFCPPPRDPFRASLQILNSSSPSHGPVDVLLSRSTEFCE